MKLITDGDVAGAIMAARDGTGVDMLVGAAAPRGDRRLRLGAWTGPCTVGLAPKDDKEREAAQAPATTWRRSWTSTTWSGATTPFFAATGVTDGELLRGVRFDRRGSLTQSLSMRSKSGTSRQIDACHQLSKLSRYASIDYG